MKVNNRLKYCPHYSPSICLSVSIRVSIIKKFYTRH